MEQRRFVVGAELRASKGEAGDLYQISGQAVRYGALSEPGVPMAGCRERIMPSCFRDSIQSGREVLALRDHDQSQILGRTRNGSLVLDDTKDALKFSIRLNPAVIAHRDLWNLVKDKTLSECSFSFGAEDDSVDPAKDERGRYMLRTVRKAKLFDVSIVSSPAYPGGATSAEARSLYRLTPLSDEEFRNQLTDEMNRRKAAWLAEEIAMEK